MADDLPDELIVEICLYTRFEASSFCVSTRWLRLMCRTLRGLLRNEEVVYDTIVEAVLRVGITTGDWSPHLWCIKARISPLFAFNATINTSAGQCPLSSVGESVEQILGLKCGCNDQQYKTPTRYRHGLPLLQVAFSEAHKLHSILDWLQFFADLLHDGIAVHITHAASITTTLGCVEGALRFRECVIDIERHPHSVKFTEVTDMHERTLADEIRMIFGDAADEPPASLGVSYSSVEQQAVALARVLALPGLGPEDVRALGNIDDPSRDAVKEWRELCLVPRPDTIEPYLDDADIISALATGWFANAGGSDSGSLDSDVSDSDSLVLLDQWIAIETATDALDADDIRELMKAGMANGDYDGSDSEGGDDRALHRPTGSSTAQD